MMEHVKYKQTGETSLIIILVSITMLANIHGQPVSFPYPATSNPDYYEANLKMPIISSVNILVPLKDNDHIL
jgi:hypothetical protein